MIRRRLQLKQPLLLFVCPLLSSLCFWLWAWLSGVLCTKSLLLLCPVAAVTGDVVCCVRPESDRVALE